MEVIHLTDSNFEKEVLQSDIPVLVDFWAERCGYCKMLLPVIAEIAKTAVEFKVGNVNTDTETDLVRKYKIMSIPALFVFKKGKPVANTVGFIPEEEIREFVQNAIKKD